MADSINLQTKGLFMRTRNVSARLAICMAVLSLLCIGCVRTGGLHENVSGDDINETYARIAEQFMKTIMDRDIKGFLDLTTLPVPRTRAVLEVEFKNKESGLYNFLFGRKQSFRAYMKKARALDYVIIEYPDRPGYWKGNEFEIIFYDRGKIKSLKGLELEELRELGYDYEIFVFFFFQPAEEHEPPDNVKGQWTMDFTMSHGYFWSKSEEDLKELYPIR